MRGGTRFNDGVHEIANPLQPCRNRGTVSLANRCSFGFDSSFVVELSIGRISRPSWKSLFLGPRSAAKTNRWYRAVSPINPI